MNDPVGPLVDLAAGPVRPLVPGPGGDPVVVVGAGPVGQTTALLLARWGLQVVVLDRRPQRDPIGSKAICQARDVLDVWESVGAGRTLAAEGVTWTTARTYYRDREIASWSFVDRGRSPFPPYVNVSQSRTEEVLDALIAATPAVQVRWGQEVTGLAQDDAGVTLELAGPDGAGALRASYVVVATGARSDGLRSALGLTFAGRSFDDAFLICDIRADLPGWERDRRFWFDPPWNPGRQVLIHACPGSTYRIDWQVPPGYDLADDEASGGLDARIRQIIGDRPYEVVWKSVYRFHSRHTERMRVGRVLLAGDAAHLVSPFGARGLNTGVLDAENAAWKVAFVAHGWAGEDLLESYHDERLAATLENLEVTGATMDFLVPGTDAERRRRADLLEAAATDPQAARRIDSGRFAEAFWYVGSPLTTPDPSRPFAGRPPKGESPPPAPGVVVPDAPLAAPALPGVARLRELARTGLVALVHPPGPAAAVRDLLAARTTAPLTVVATTDLGDDGLVARELGIRPGEAWLLRPDAYVAAVVDVTTDPDGAALAAALDRVLAVRAAASVPLDESGSGERVVPARRSPEPVTTAARDTT